jgi:hypothetical protein
MHHCSSTYAARVITVATLALSAGPALAADVSVKAACESLSLEACTLQTLQMRPGDGDTLRLDLVTSGQDRSLVLWPHDNRSDNFRLIVQESDGSFTEETPGPVTTYRGTDVNDTAVIIAVGFEDDGFRLRLIEADGSQWFAEPLIDRLEGADINDYAVYRGEAIISPENICPIDEAWRAGGMPSTDFDGTGGYRGTQLAAEMAVDADFEFFQQYGSVSGVENRVNAVINSVNSMYESQCFLTHEIQAIVVRSTSDDPYSSNSIETRLDQLQNDWNSGNHPGIARDIVHLFTGVDTGSTIGLAYLGAVCSSSEYGVVQSNCCGSFGCATDLSAHEMGHNWNAGHCSCPSNTMNPSLTCANNFTQGSRNTIMAFADSISGCLHVPGPSGACCLGANCQYLTQGECTDIGGAYQGDGTDCGSTECNLGTGACCLSSGSCATVSESQCNNVGGTYQGDNVPCDDELCALPPTGACCYGSTCTVTEEPDCGGTYMGDETTCDNDPCTANNFAGIGWKVVGTNLVDDPQDTWTVDVYAMVGAGERIDAVAGNQDQQKTVSSSAGFWQSTFGGPTSIECNPAFYPLAPDLEFDSRVTIGALDSSGNPFGENVLSTIGIDFSNFENGGAISANNGTWYVLASDAQGEAQPVVTDDCSSGHGVLIGRLTAYGLSSEVMVEALFQGRNVLGTTFQANAASTGTLGSWADCNENGTSDACDIAGGGSQDANGNGIPDECETSGCQWDLNGDGGTTVDDLLMLIADFGTTYDVDDLLALLAEFGCS